ncbi:MAG: hypothetical protein WBB82_05215 [Limnothrix sp.]
MARQHPKKIKYNWWTDRPRHVGHAEYQRFRLIVFGAIATGFLAVISVFFAVTGNGAKTAEELAELPSVSVAEAIASTKDLDLAKLSGVLVAKNPPTMPDEPTLKVIRGEITLTARDEAVRDDVTVKEVIFAWAEAAETIFLVDGDQQIPVAIDLARFPFPSVKPAFDAKPRVQSEGASSRVSKPVAIAYANQEFPLDLARWANADNAFLELDRNLLRDGQAAVIVASVQDGKLVEPSGDRLRIELGTEPDIRVDNQRRRLIFAIIWLPLGIISYFLAKYSYGLNQDFIRRSNS